MTNPCQLEPLAVNTLFPSESPPMERGNVSKQKGGKSSLGKFQGQPCSGPDTLGSPGA